LPVFLLYVYDLGKKLDIYDFNLYLSRSETCKKFSAIEYIECTYIREDQVRCSSFIFKGSLKWQQKIRINQLTFSDARWQHRS